MTAYVLAQLRIDDPDEYQNYLAGFMPIFERHGVMIQIIKLSLSIDIAQPRLI